jgi:alkyldihydroxyacetonephosphate synthase
VPPTTDRTGPPQAGSNSTAACLGTVSSSGTGPQSVSAAPAAERLGHARHRQTVPVVEQPELTIQGWGPAGARIATVAAGDGAGSPEDGVLGFAPDPDASTALPRAARRHLTRELGWTPRSTPPVPVSAIRLAPSRLPADARTALTGLLGEDAVADDRATRLAHAGGKSYLDLLRRRAGDASDAPDAVLTPASTEQTAALLSECSERGIVVVPFGGGTSVVGGLAGTDVDDRPVVAVDLARMSTVQDLDVPSSLVTVGPGMRGPALEEELAQEGLTLGHLPQSWEFATLGGYAATRSAGQSSTGVGRFDDLVAGLTLATPVGVLELGKPPASAAGPDLLGLALGSEGTLGVITELRLRVRPIPRTTSYEGWSFRSWAAGLAGLQRLARHDLLPDVVRLSDPDATRATLLQSAGAGSRVLRAGLRGRRHGQGCLLVVGWEGLPTIVRARQRAATSVLRDSGAVRLGRRVGQAWVRQRFAAPYLRDRLLDAGLLVETLETAATWTALPGVYDAVRRALHDALTGPGRRPLVMCHLSHGYPTGASLYVTVLADRDDDLPIQQWLAAKRAATDALLAAGGTLTHHHAVGVDHRPWLTEEVGALGVDVLRAVKQQLDPERICNPGVLLPD